MSKMMKTIIVFAIFCCIDLNIGLTTPTYLASSEPVGFGSGTTGGQAGKIVTVTTAEQLKAAAESKQKLVIYVNGTISGGPAGISIVVRSNKSIIGSDNGATLEGIGFHLYKVQNVVIRNLKMTLSTLVNPKLQNVSGDQCIVMNSGILIWIEYTNYVWIDHCELYNDLPNTTMRSIYHMLLAVSHGSRFMTFSWNRFHDMGRTLVFGSCDSDTAPWSFTMHHNLFENLQERNPMVRGGIGHVYNNYFRNIYYYGVCSVLNACIKVERNAFTNVNDSIVGNHPSIASRGKIDNIENLVRGGRTLIHFDPSPAPCSLKIPYAYNAEDVATAMRNVLEHAGTGPLSEQPRVKWDAHNA